MSEELMPEFRETAESDDRLIKQGVMFGEWVVTRAQPPAFPSNSNGRWGFPGPTQEEA